MESKVDISFSNIQVNINGYRTGLKTLLKMGYWPKARIPHVCKMCRRRIKEKEYYFRVLAVKLCPNCALTLAGSIKDKMIEIINTSCDKIAEKAINSLPLGLDWRPEQILPEDRYGL